MWNRPPREIDVEARIDAPPHAVFGLLDDSSSWPGWTPIDAFTLDRPAAEDGLGEVRRFTTGRVTVTEEIVERVPDERLTYVLLGGLAVRDYRAQIDLRPDGSHTTLRWHTTFRPKVPGTGWLYHRALRKATRDFVDGLARQAASDAGRR